MFLFFPAVITTEEERGEVTVDHHRRIAADGTIVLAHARIHPVSTANLTLLKA